MPPVLNVANWGCRHEFAETQFPTDQPIATPRRDQRQHLRGEPVGLGPLLLLASQH
jgi:hypothetical protein